MSKSRPAPRPTNGQHTPDQRPPAYWVKESIFAINFYDRFKDQVTAIYRAQTMHDTVKADYDKSPADSAQRYYTGLTLAGAAAAVQDAHETLGRAVLEYLAIELEPGETGKVI